MIKGIIFDLDGVIVHTDEMHYRAWKQVAERIGVSFNGDMNNRLRDVSRIESLEMVLENAKPVSDAEKLILADEKNAAYKKIPETLSEEGGLSFSALLRRSAGQFGCLRARTRPA